MFIPPPVPDTDHHTPHRNCPLIGQAVLCHCPLIGQYWSRDQNTVLWLAGCDLTTRTVPDTGPKPFFGVWEKKVLVRKKVRFKTIDLKCAGVNLEPAKNSSLVSEISHKLSYNFGLRGPPTNHNALRPHVWNWHYYSGAFTASTPGLQSHRHFLAAVTSIAVCMGLSINVDQQIQPFRDHLLTPSNLDIINGY